MRHLTIWIVVVTLCLPLSALAQRLNAEMRPSSEELPAPAPPAPQTTSDDPEAVVQASKQQPSCSLCVTAKPGKGIGLKTPDNTFALRVRPRIQIRYAGSRDGDDGSFSQAFMIRRARVTMTGHMFGENYKFKAELAFSPKDVGLKNGVLTKSPLLDWYVQFAHLRDLNVRVGQFKVPFNRQRLTSSGNLQMVDRSLAQGEFHFDRDIGATVLSKDLFGLGLFRYAVGVFVGEGRDAYLPGDLGLLYVARIEALPLAPWTGGFDDDGSETDLKRRRHPQLSIGLAAAFLDEAKKNRGIKGSTPADLGTTDIYGVTADVNAKWAGFSLIAEAFARYGFRNPGAAVDDKGKTIATEVARQGYGGTLQAGYLLPLFDLEVTTRYSLVRAFGETSLNASDELGMGVNYYLAGHSMKFQVDLFQRYHQFNLATGDTQVRAQLQAAF